jgi:L-threonylcarbamoyladenylate synthase
VQTEILSIKDSSALQKALEILHSGGIIAFPTDTVYGLAADLQLPRAIQRLYEVKGREEAKAIPVLVGSIDQLDLVAAGLSEQAASLAVRYWPGALTLVVERRPELPSELSELPTVGVRMPNHPFALELLRASGPLAVTSANRSGEPSPQTVEDVLAQLDGRVELVLDGGRCPGGVPSTVVDCTGLDLKILRQGAIPAADILK